MVLQCIKGETACISSVVFVDVRVERPKIDDIPLLSKAYHVHINGSVTVPSHYSLEC